MNKEITVEEMFEVCVQHYMKRGYSREHCEGYINCLNSERKLKRVYEEICEEERQAQEYEQIYGRL